MKYRLLFWLGMALYVGSHFPLYYAKDLTAQWLTVFIMCLGSAFLLVGFIGGVETSPTALVYDVWTEEEMSRKERQKW